MALIKASNFWPKAYHKITSFEINTVLQKIVIRTVVYPDKDTKDVSTGIEYKIKPQTLTPLMRAKAETLVDAGAIRKNLEDMAKENKQNKTDTEREILRQTEIAIVNKMAELGEQEMQSYFTELNNNPALKVNYNILKKLPEFSGAIDA